MKINFLFFAKIFSFALWLFLLLSHPSKSQIILSEVMFDPLGSEYYNEFIEIYNINATDTIDLADWQISDSMDTDFIIAYGRGTRLNPQSFALILDPGYFENSQQYENLIPQDVLILTIDDGSFGAQGLSNRNSEPIILISSTGDTVAKYRYSLDNQPGYSDEKRNLLGDDSPENWANSNVLNGTPGFLNSVRQFDNDISIELLGFPPEASPGQSIFLIASVTNIGINSAWNIEISFFEDLNLDSLFSTDEQVGPTMFIQDSLRPGENQQVRMAVDSLSSGPHSFYARAIFPQDQNIINNVASIDVKIGFPPNTIVINEIMYRPSTGEAEWIELYNPENEPVNIKQWQFSDAHTEIRINLSDSVIYVPNQDFLIIAEDSAIFHGFPNIPSKILIPSQGFPALNNSGDLICIYDLIGTIIDRVNYAPTWGSETGISLERKLWNRDSNDPLNWSLSKNSEGGTPGFRNSVSPKNHDLSLNVSITLSVPDSIDIIATIYNIGLLPAAQFRCDFYLDQNMDSLSQEKELVSSFTYKQEPLLSNDSTIIFHKIAITNQGLNQVVSKLIYDLDENQSDNVSINQLFVPFKHGQLVLNEIMFRPLSGYPEWIEIFYPGKKPINLFGWKFSDSNTQQKHIITTQNFLIHPGCYIVLAESEDIITQIRDSSSINLFIPSSWPTLNNTYDQVILYDLIDNTIDSVTYYSNWSPNSGLSLERIDFLKPSTDSTNWAPSIDSTGSTPGRFNSVSLLDFDLAVTGMSYSPENPFPGNEIIITIWITNVGRLSISEFQIICYLDLNQDSLFQENEKIGNVNTFNQFFEQEKTINISIHYIPSHSGRYWLNAQVSTKTDFKSSNNSYSDILSVGFEQYALVINEIMYSPSPEQPEWIELYNPKSNAVDIQNWTFSDSDSSDRKIIMSDHFYVEPHSFLVLTEDSTLLDYFDLQYSTLLTFSSWPNLNNDQDEIFIFDANGNIIDELHYNNRWGGNQGNSMERINPDLASNDSSNWDSCVEIRGGTPGRKNSIYVEMLPAEAELSISPNPFSPDGDGRDDVTIINYQLPFNLSQIHIKIFDVRGRLVRFLVNNRPSGINGSIIWDGRDDKGHICRMGIYIVYLEAIHYDRGVVKSLKKSVVLAKQL